MTGEIEIEPQSDPDIRLADYVAGAPARATRERRDRALAERVCAGDSAAFTTLYHAYRPRLYRLAYEYTHNREDAEDVVHEVFSNVWEIRAKWSVKASVAAYLCGAIRNRATDLLRRAKTEQQHRSKSPDRSRIAAGGQTGALDMRAPLQAPTTGEAVFNSGERRLMTADLRAVIEDTMAAMPPRCREVLQISRCMSGDDALSYAEIGEALHITPSTVRQHLIKAIDILEARLAVAGWPNVLRRQDCGRLAPGSNEP